MARGARVLHLSGVPAVEDHGLAVEADWRPIRHHLGIRAFGVNAYTGEAGQVVIEDHEEADTGHEELYFVASGAAEFDLGEDRVTAPAGTFVFFEDPALRRRAVATDAATTVIAIGARPGEAFTPSHWETRRTAEIERAA